MNESRLNENEIIIFRFLTQFEQAQHSTTQIRVEIVKTVAGDWNFWFFCFDFVADYFVRGQSRSHRKWKSVHFSFVLCRIGMEIHSLSVCCSMEFDISKLNWTNFPFFLRRFHIDWISRWMKLHVNRTVGRIVFDSRDADILPDPIATEEIITRNYNEKIIIKLSATDSWPPKNWFLHLFNQVTVIFVSLDVENDRSFISHILNILHSHNLPRRMRIKWS